MMLVQRKLHDCKFTVKASGRIVNWYISPEWWWLCV